MEFLRRFSLFLGVFVLLSVARAQESAPKGVQVQATTQGGFARILFDWPDEVAASGQVVDGVLVIRFDRPFDVDTNTLSKTLEPYAALVRKDADGKGIRMALKGPVRLKATDLAVRHAFDLLPPNFKGEPSAVPAPENATPQRQLAVRVTEREKTTRLQFDFPGEVDYSFRMTGGKLLATFNKPAKVDLARFAETPPAWVRAARAINERNKLTLEFDVDPEADFRDVSENGEIAVLLQEPKTDAVAMTEKATPAGAPRVILSDDASLAPPPPRVPADEIAFDRPARKGAKAAAAAPAAGPVSAKPARQDDEKALQTQAANLEHAIVDVPSAVPSIAVADPLPNALRLGQTDLSAALAPMPSGAPVVPGVARAQVFGTILRIELPYAQLPAAAVFRRGLAVWVIVDSPAAMDLAAITEVPSSPVGVLSAPAEIAPGVTAFRLAVPYSMSISFAPAGDSWVLAVGNAVPEVPQRLQMVRHTKGKDTQVRIPMPGITQVLWLKDPDLEDRIAVVLGHAPARGLLDGRRFVDFTALPTRHGIAIQSVADDLSVVVDGNEAVISRPSGLNATSAQVVEGLSAVAPAEPAKSTAAAEYLLLDREPDNTLHETLGKLILASANSPDGRSAPRMALARHYVANGFGAEALGVLRTIIHTDKTAEADPSLRVIRALANIQMARHQEALEDLNIESLANDPHLSMWKGIASAGARNWREARNNLVAGMKVMGEYPPDWHARGRTALALASLEMGDAAAAKVALDAVPKSGLSPVRQAELQLAQALTDQAVDRNDQALASFDQLARSPVRHVATRASLEGTLAKLKQEKIGVAQAIDALERLRFQWRGDELELRTLSELAQLYVRDNKLRDAMGTMRVAVRNFGDTEDARNAAAQMTTMFESFFIGDEEKRLEPLDALSLFYDYKELTPVGVRGDEMIRRLVERLVAVDLLPQAAELLQHQVDNRLDGVAKSAVAVRLAVIYLLDKHPAKAIQTIRTTRQTRLPDDLIEQRDLIEARALSDTKEHTHALEVLESHTSDEAEQLRADILWDAQRWPEAAAKSEAILGTRYAGDDALDELERMSLMRACVAYSLAGDLASLERLRTRFQVKMQGSPDANAFALLTSAPDVTSEDYRTLVKRIASVEMLEAFFNEFKSKGAAVPEFATN